jgi:hypothetical protein
MVHQKKNLGLRGNRVENEKKDENVDPIVVKAQKILQEAKKMGSMMEQAVRHVTR